MKTPENSAGGEDFADEPLDLNPWEANDPKGLSGRPDAEPSPPGIRKMRWVVVTFVVVNVLDFFIVPHQGDSVFGEIMTRLFPLIPLLFSTRGMARMVDQVQIPTGDLGKRGWQRMYNKFRVYLVLFGLGGALVRLIFDLAIIAGDGSFDGITRVIFWVVAIAALVGNAVAVFRLRDDARELAGWGKK